MNSYQSYASPAPGSSHGYGTGAYPGPYYGSSMLTSPPGPAHHPPSLGGQLMPLAGLHSSGQPSYSSQHNQPYNQGPSSGLQPDHTGQVPPPNHKPKVTATLWEDEGTICFQVECDGLCVARREDNQFINGTKLLNVAGMTRGRRDGILKSEKTRQVVKIGPMHLKGVWIPYERALDFANREKITEKLYPLFVHNISNLLPQGVNRNPSLGTRGGKLGMSGPPPLTQHPSMQLPSHLAGPPRPGVDRAHTFHTPPTPTSASSVMNQGSEYWTSSSMNGSMQSSASSMNIENGVANPRSMPNTPASTPPGSSLQSITGFPSQATQGQYSSQYNSSHPYIKNDMGPPSRSNTLPSSDHKDAKSEQQFGPGHHAPEVSGADQPSGYSYSGISGNHSDGGDHVPTTTSQEAAPGQITPRTSISNDQWTGYQTPPRTNTYPGAPFPSTLINSSNKRSRDEEEHDFKMTSDLDNLKRHKSSRDDILTPRPGIMQQVGR